MSVYERNSTAASRRAYSEVNTRSTGDRTNQRSEESSLLRPVILVLLVFAAVFYISTRRLSDLEAENIAATQTADVHEIHEAVFSSSAECSYAIVFDAGSTGSRIHVYRFHIHTDGSLRLKDELFEEVKPGLSSYAAKPSDAGVSISPLLEKAKQFIPEADWHRVPMALYATAGLRLVSDSIAQQILDEVRHTFARSPFRVCSDCVRILDGIEEGTYAWYAINYMLGRIKLGAGPVKPTVGVIDLGGGSMQITFLAKPVDEGTPRHFLHKTTDFGGEPLMIYSHSYLGLGLNAARFELLAMTTSDADLHLPKSANGAPRKWTDIDPDASVTYTSPCFAESYTGIWRYHGVDVHVRGVSPTEGTKAIATQSRFDTCYGVAKRLVTTETDVHHPPAVHRLTFYIQSYFLDRAVDVGLITEKDGGMVTIKDYEKVGRRICDKEIETSQPFLCMDLSFITALLHDGFEFDSNTTIVLKKKLHGFELSWTIGAVFPLFR